MEQLQMSDPFTTPGWYWARLRGRPQYAENQGWQPVRILQRSKTSFIVRMNGTAADFYLENFEWGSALLRE